MSFANRLKATRKQKGYSQEMLAEKLDVSRQSVTKWETGIAYPEIKTLLELSSVLEKDLDWLLQDEKPGRNMYNSPGYDFSYNEANRFHDRRSLDDAMEQDLLMQLLRVLDGYEIVRIIETKELEGTQSYIFYKGRVFSETVGFDPVTNESIQAFSEMNLSEIRSLLLPWGDLQKRKLGAQLQVAKKQPEDGGNHSR